MHSNGKANHHHNESIVDKLCAVGLLQDADRDNHDVVNAALSALLDKVETVPPGRPIPNIYITAQVECAANTHMLHALIELLVAFDVLPAKAIEALLVKSKGSGDAAYMPAGLAQLLNHYAVVMAWQLKPHGVSIDHKAIVMRGQK
jgi:hypothetical protein